MSISIGGIFTFIVILVAIAVFVWLAFYVLQNFPPPEPLGRIIRVAIVVLAVLVLIAILLQFAGVGTPIRLSETKSLINGIVGVV